MSPRQQKQISITGTLYKQLRAYADAQGVSMPKAIEPLILRALDDGWLPTTERIVQYTLPSTGRPVVREQFSIEVPRAIYELVDDQVIRARELAGQTVTHAALFEQAIVAALAAEGA